MADETERTDDQLYEDYNIYESEDSDSGDKVDPKTQSQSPDTVEEPEGEADNRTQREEDDQKEPEDKSDTPEEGGDKFEITDDATYLLDGEEISGKELQGRMLLKSKYDERVREHEENVVKPNEQALNFVDKLREGLRDDPVDMTTRLFSNIANDYQVDVGNVIHSMLQVAHQNGQLIGVTLFNEDEGEQYEPEPQQRPQEDPRVQQQVQTMEQRAFMAEMKADRIEAMNLPEIKKAGVELKEGVQQRADQLYGLYRSNPAYSPDPNANNQYSLALVTAWNEMVMRGEVQPQNPAPPAEKPNLLDNKKSSKNKRVSPTVPEEAVDPEDQLYRKYGIYK